MKKSVKTALSVGFILLVLGMALVAVALARGTSLQELWNNGSLSVNLSPTGFGRLDGYTVCSTGEESFSPAEVRHIDLGWISGSVTLAPGGDRLTLKESCAQGLKEEQKLCWKLDKGTLFVRFCSAAQTRLTEKDLVLTVPTDWTAESISVGATSGNIVLRDLQIDKTLTVTATSGDLRLENCRCDRLEAGTTSGSADLQGCECRSLKLGATSGGLRAEGCRCDSLEAGATSGNIYVRSEAKEIELGSTSGAIRCEDVPALCDVRIDTTSGTVRLGLRGTGDDQRIAVETTSGDVYLDVPGAIDLDFDTASGKLSGRLEQGGSGCPQVEIDTTSGDLILGAFD